MTELNEDHPMPRVAVIGAGISGLMCARTLADHGFPVTVVEKSRGVAGRMATRRTESGLRFDHGTQYFTVRDKRFQRYVESWIHDDIVKPWNGRIVVLENGQITDCERDTERYVASPGMNAICKHLAEGLDIRLHTQAAPPVRKADHWHLESADGTDLGSFDVVIVSAPAHQTATLLHAAPPLAARARQTEMHGCWALMLAFPQSLPLDFNGAFVHGSPISWIANNRSKPGRDDGIETWVIHAADDWSQVHLEEQPAAVQETLLREYWKATGLSPRDPANIFAHRWRFAKPPSPLHDNCLFDAGQNIGACGDWCVGSRVEDAFLSGVAAAGRVMGLPEHPSPPSAA